MDFLGSAMKFAMNHVTKPQEPVTLVNASDTSVQFHCQLHEVVVQPNSTAKKDWTTQFTLGLKGEADVTVWTKTLSGKTVSGTRVKVNAGEVYVFDGKNASRHAVLPKQFRSKKRTRSSSPENSSRSRSSSPESSSEGSGCFEEPKDCSSESSSEEVAVAPKKKKEKLREMDGDYLDPPVELHGAELLSSLMNTEENIEAVRRSTGNLRPPKRKKMKKKHSEKKKKHSKKKKKHSKKKMKQSKKKMKQSKGKKQSKRSKNSSSSGKKKKIKKKARN